MSAQSAEAPSDRHGRWMTVPEVAALLRKSARTIRRWCDSGFLAGSRRVGKSWLIPESAIDALLSNQPVAA